ncbi:MAG: hypothetical protein OXC81_03410 [Betaproteobacteria bacterium]|nr:hypothetical protein [Betaproteobacteria bacterium]
MSDALILSELIAVGALAKQEGAGKASVHLQEPDAEHSVQISGLPKDAFVIEADKSLREADNKVSMLKSIFGGGHNECKMADYIIISPACKIIVCVELKSSRRNIRPKAVWQLTGASCLVAYIREVGRKFWRADNFLADYDYRYAVIIKHSAKKTSRQLREDDQRKHNTPDKFLGISTAQRVSFRYLAGLPRTARR